MTREEAILHMTLRREELKHSVSDLDEDIKAFDMAIEALEQEPKIGHWIEENINEYSRKVFCSECGCPPPFEHISNGDVYSASGHGEINKTNYCPNCGAKMESEDESDK